ncbi:hypothetical protein MLE16_001560 [Klebsiella oxytoca]|nr:hypothetical protein [Klebsiella oxytoca]
MNISTVNELIQSLESAGELSIKETKVMALAKAYLDVAAENVALKAGIAEEIEVINRGGQMYCVKDGMSINPIYARGWNDHRANLKAVKTPATDRIVAGIKADAAAPLVSALKVIANSEQHNGDTVVCDFDTLISVAAGALRDYYAKQLREEADK